MNEMQTRAADALIAFGFDASFSRIMIRTGELPCPLTEDVFANAELLRRTSGLKNLPPLAAIFLKRDARTNAFLETIPEKYAFSAEQTRKYRENPLNWTIFCDLKPELDADLCALLPDAEARMRVYRDMYLSGAWADCETLREICRALAAIAPNPKALEAFAEREWFVLFSYYAGTLEYIAALKERLAPEQVWPALCAHPENTHAFSSSFHSYDERAEILNRLEKEYSK